MAFIPRMTAPTLAMTCDETVAKRCDIFCALLSGFSIPFAAYSLVFAIAGVRSSRVLR